MATAIFCCGAECNISAVGAAPGTGGARHWDTFDSGTSIVATGYNGGNAYKATTAAGAAVTFRKVLATPTILVGRFRVRFDTSVPSADCMFAAAGTSAGTFPGIKFVSASSKIFACLGATNGATGVSVVADTWYVVDFKFDVSSGTRTVDVKVDGTACGQASASIAAGNMATMRFGTNPATTSANATISFDDIILSVTSGDYPIGVGQIEGLKPNADGTHSFSTTGDFLYDGSSNIASGATDTWSHLADINSTTAFLQGNEGTNEYLEHAYPSLAGTPTSVNCVTYVGGHWAAGTQANKVTMQLRESGSSTTLFADIDDSQTSLVYESKTLATKPSTGAWTNTAVDGITTRYLSSTGTADTTPNTKLSGIVLEVDYVPGTSAHSDDLNSASYGVSGLALTALLALSLGTASYGITGQAAGDAISSAPVAGSYAVTGAGLTAAYASLDSLTPGSYAITGATLTSAPGANLTSNAFAITGSGLGAAVAESVAAQSYGVTGLASQGAGTEPTGAGAYVISGATMTAAATEPLALGTYAITGAAADEQAPSSAKSDDLALGDYVVSGTGLGVALADSLAISSYAITGATLSGVLTAPLTTGAYVVIGADADEISPSVVPVNEALQAEDRSHPRYASDDRSAPRFHFVVYGPDEGSGFWSFVGELWSSGVWHWDGSFVP